MIYTAKFAKRTAAGLSASSVLMLCTALVVGSDTFPAFETTRLRYSTLKSNMESSRRIGTHDLSPYKILYNTGTASDLSFNQSLLEPASRITHLQTHHRPCAWISAPSHRLLPSRQSRFQCIALNPMRPALPPPRHPLRAMRRSVASPMLRRPEDVEPASRAIPSIPVELVDEPQEAGLRGAGL
jgi:hypothetical protein